MTEKSWPWDTNTGLGDGSAELTEALSRQFLAHLWAHDLTEEGVFKGVGDELAVSGTASPVTVEKGAAICYGLYMSDAQETLAVSTPSLGTTGFRVVLRTNWAGTSDGAVGEARTRLAVKRNSDGVAAIPSLTQSFGTTWEISLATGTITTGGVISLTDDRTFRKVTGVVGSDELEDEAVTAGKVANDVVTNANLRNSAALSVIGRSANSTGDPADIAAGSDGQVLRRSGTSLGFGQVAAAGIANDAIDDTKVGNRVPQFYRRQGGSANDWDVSGTTTYTPTSVRMQAGTVGVGGTGNVGVTFPVAFSQTPIVIAIPHETPSLTKAAIVGGDLSETGFTLYLRSPGGPEPGTVMWLAIGPE